MDKKHDILRHPNVNLSTDGSGEPSPAAEEPTTYELLSSDELEAQIFKEEPKRTTLKLSASTSAFRFSPC
mgnify:CR=1 FL=1